MGSVDPPIKRYTNNHGEIVTVMQQSVIRACPFFIFTPDHYRDDGSCKCDDPAHREMMIKEWEYSPEDFKGIPLREV